MWTDQSIVKSQYTSSLTKENKSTLLVHSRDLAYHTRGKKTITYIMSWLFRKRFTMLTTSVVVGAERKNVQKSALINPKTIL